MRMIRSFSYAVQGISTFFQKEANGRIQLLAATGAVLMGLVLHLRAGEWTAIMGCIAIVLSFEMMNTALEKLCDLVQPGFHPQVKQIKDIAAGAVLFTSIISALIGAAIFLPKLINVLCLKR